MGTVGIAVMRQTFNLEVGVRILAVRFDCVLGQGTLPTFVSLHPGVEYKWVPAYHEKVNRLLVREEWRIPIA